MFFNKLLGFVGAKILQDYSECHHGSLRDHDKHRLLLVVVVLE